MRDRIAALLLAGAILAPASARADDTIPVGHAAYGIGGALGPDGGFRQNLDLALGMGFLERRGHGMFAPEVGPTVGAGAVLGFGTYPSFATLEAGWASVTILGWSAAVGPALRLDHGVAFGASARATAQIFAVQLGVHALATGGPDVQLCGTIGLGID